MKKQLSRYNRLNLTISEKEKNMVTVLKNDYGVNISGYIRKTIRELYKEKQNEK